MRAEFMADKTAIEWTDATWNPVTGCTKISAGCDNCYAERFSERFRDTPGHYFKSGFDLTLRPQRLDQPLAWKQPRRIFVNSMSDLFHKSVPVDYINSVFDVMERAGQHVYQVLTKRSSLLRNFVNARYGNGSAPDHIWLGVSIESPKYLVRLEHLKQTRAAVRFLSFEPLIERMGTVEMSGIKWAIVGGESGHGARPIDPMWVRELRDQCRRQNVAFFFKQWGGRTPKAQGNTIDGRQWLDFPDKGGRRGTALSLA
jgi:protein gp37